MVQSKLGTKNLKLLPEGNALRAYVLVCKLVWNTEHSSKNMEELNQQESQGRGTKTEPRGKYSW